MTLDDEPDIYRGLPLEILEAVDRYLRKGFWPGSGLGGVLTSDLAVTLANADDVLWEHLRTLVRYLYNRVPNAAWGSAEKVHRWMRLDSRQRDEILALTSHAEYFAARCGNRKF